jgi:hypothetical protein
MPHLTKEQRFSANPVVVNLGDRAEHLFLLTHGHARHFFITEHGKKILLRCEISLVRQHCCRNRVGTRWARRW